MCNYNYGKCFCYDIWKVITKAGITKQFLLYFFSSQTECIRLSNNLTVTFKIWRLNHIYYTKQFLWVIFMSAPQCLISNKVQFHPLVGSIAMAHFGSLALFHISKGSICSLFIIQNFWHINLWIFSERLSSEIAKHILRFVWQYFPQNFDPDLQSEYEESEGLWQKYNSWWKYLVSSTGISTWHFND